MELWNTSSSGYRIVFTTTIGDEVDVLSLSSNTPGRDRTCDRRFRKPLLYPLSYEGNYLFSTRLIGVYSVEQRPR